MISTILILIMSREFSDANTSKNTDEKEKPFKCSGCKTPLDKFEERCPNCERLNPNYYLR